MNSTDLETCSKKYSVCYKVISKITEEFFRMKKGNNYASWSGFIILVFYNFIGQTTNNVYVCQHKWYRRCIFYKGSGGFEGNTGRHESREGGGVGDC